MFINLLTYPVSISSCLGNDSWLLLRDKRMKNKTNNYCSTTFNGCVSS